MNRQRIGILNIPSCSLSRVVALSCALSAALPAPAALSTGKHDPVFERLQFDRWMPASQSRMKWTVEVPPAELSTHQRLMFRVVTKIDGRELEKRQGEGELVGACELSGAW